MLEIGICPIEAKDVGTSPCNTVTEGQTGSPADYVSPHTHKQQVVKKYLVTE